MFVMTPPNEHTSEGGRDDRGVPYHAESTLSSAHPPPPAAAQGVHAVMDKAARLKRVLGGLGGARDGGALMAKGGCGGDAPRHREAIRTVSLSDLRQLSTALCS